MLNLPARKLLLIQNFIKPGMQKVSGIFLIILNLFLFSCAEKSQFPEKKSERFKAQALTLYQPVFQQKTFITDSLATSVVSPQLLQLKSLISKYENRDKEFSLEKMESLWELEKNKIDFNGLETISLWIEATGFLLEITGKPVYAEALQKLSSAENVGLSASESELAEQQLASFIFTKNVDHIFVNLLVNSSVEYVHSLDGKVKITQESKGAGGFLLKFNMDEKRYIEVNILIPTWTTNATVIEKNVKYVATPGEYCFIARKWKEGDFVEVNF